MSDSLRLQTLALLGQQFLTHALANGGSLDSATADALLRPHAKSGRDISSSALTGRIRSDAGMLRQSAKNASEGAAMASLIKGGTLSLADTLNKMQTLLQQPSPVDAQAEFTTLVSTLRATIDNTQYNGISLLHGGSWNSDERVSASGDTGTITLQVGGAPSTFNLRDLSALGGRYDGLDLTDSAAVAGALTQISKDLGTVTTMSTGYEALAGSYLSEAKHLEKQSEMLTLTALRAQGGIAGDTPSNPDDAAKNILLDILLRDQGNLVNKSS